MLARGVAPNTTSGAPLGVVELAPDGQGIELILDLPVPIGSADGPPVADCLLVVMREGEPQQSRRVLARSSVPSEYAAGTKRRRNPQYLEAQRALSQEERDGSGSRGPRLRSTGDTMLDLIALLGTGVITGVDALLQRGERAQAQQQLAQVPEWIEEPEWRPYRLSLQEVEISRQAGLRLALLDTRSGKGWRVRQDASETRLLRIADGLHKDDRNRVGAERRQDGYVDAATARTIEQGPMTVKLSALVSGLAPAVGAEAGAPLTLAGLIAEPRPAPAALAALPDLPVPVALPAASRSRPAGPTKRGSIVAIAGMNGESSGFYLAPDKILALAKSVGETSLVRIEGQDGFVTWGIVQHEEAASGLVLLHVPREGPPLSLSSAAVDLAALKGEGLAPGVPLLADGRVVAVAVEPGVVVGAAEIRSFLERAQKQ